MPRSTFQIPEVQAKTISQVSYNIYRGRLNKLASAGISNREELLNNQTLACEIVKKHSQTKQQGRIFLSAIFYVLADTPNDQKEIFYKEFQKYKDPIPQ